MFNSTIPAPGSKGVVVARDISNGVEIVGVHVYPPKGSASITLDGALFPGPFANDTEIRQAIEGALNNAPVKIVKI